MQLFQDDEIEGLVLQLRTLGAETETVEFKLNEASTPAIGEYISALANMAALRRTTEAYMVWGITDDSHKIVGTTFDPWTAVVRKQPLQLYLNQNLSSHAEYKFHETNIDGHHVVLLIVAAAQELPVEFKGQGYGRVDSHKVEFTPKYKYLERQVWEAVRRTNFEDAISLDRLSGSDVINLLDLGPYSDSFAHAISSDPEEVLETLKTLGASSDRDDGKFQITNLGALLFAKDLQNFPNIARKAVRVTVYPSTNRVDNATQRQDGVMGYAVGFRGLVRWLNNLLPSEESIIDGVRTVKKVFPEAAVREVIANAIIHQDLSVQGAGPTIEIFEDRIEVTNPGSPIPSIERLIDTPPISRNERIAALMRQMRFCEELGTGWDKIADATERNHLPSPKVQVVQNSTRVTVYGPRNLRLMEKEDQLRAVYMHACLRYVNSDRLTNKSLRERFRVADRNASQMSRLISEAVDTGRIKLHDETAGKKSRSYVPFWA